MHDYLSERFRLAQLVEAPVQVHYDPHNWGARVIESRVAGGALLVRITDAEYMNPTTGDLVRCLSEWPLEKRRAYSDLHWCIEVFDVETTNLLVRQHAPDTEIDSLVEYLQIALTATLGELEPTICQI